MMIRVLPAISVNASGEHVDGEAGLSAGDALLHGAAVGHGQQAPDPAGDGVLGQRRVGELAEFLQAGLPVCHPQLARHGQVLRRVRAEDLQGAFHPRARRHRGARAAAQVGVVEVGQPVGGGPDLAAHPALLPGRYGLVRAQPGQHGGDRLAVPDHHPVHPAHVAGLGVDLQPPRGADQGERRLGAGAGDLQRHRAARLGQRAVGQERAPPGRFAVARRARYHLPGQAADRAAVGVDEPGLPGQALAGLPLAYPDQVAVPLAQPARGEHEELGRVAEHLGDARAQPPGRRSGVELGLDDDPPLGQVQPAGEPEQRGDLGLAAAGLDHLNPAELVLHHAGHRHAPSLPPWAPVKICAYIPASSLGSCLGVPSAAATSAITSRAPSTAAAFSRSARLPVPAALVSARTTSTVSAGACLARTSRCLCGENPSVSPGCGTRLRTTRRRAVVACSAAESSGTSRCGSTLVNHEPGPNTIQSASSTARTASGTAGGSAGSSVIDRTWPGVLATAACPRTVLTSSGLPWPAPVTSATMSSGTAAMGSTRPPVPSSLPTQSRPATVSPSRSHSATMSRLPTAWPASSWSPANRCCTTLLQVVPHSSSPHSAASAIRRSPGGRTPKSRRSRPLEPPLSATVTIAVRLSVTCRNAASEAARPCPPPSATALGPATRCSLPP